MSATDGSRRSRHRHVWTALHYKPGKFAERTDTHRHQCFDCDDCYLEGYGDRCDNDRSTHKVVRYDDA